ncbi:S8 family peptidase [Polaribacter sp. IC073]|uniref:S8 family peptidase n=1 Tax=Polaribacter sp. IC073 TaxID=2508540 RepID=UPI0011BE4C43|nr:S8 family peptidase [Polaribacter sp. IC073]TXD49753.1 S8 family serine peptidase [Polaribacter sp. IC073]
MSVLKPIIYTAVAAFLLASCKTSVNTIPVPNGADTVINVPAKKSVLSESEMQVWSHMDLQTDSIPGMSVAKAHQFLEGKKGTTVIVAIADSGIDVEHEDLKDVAWVNPKEIAGNNKDDDNNGYVDDMHGWNFLGNKAGTIVNADQLELTRIVKKGMDKFGDKKASEIADADKTEFEEYLKLKEKHTKSIAAHQQELVNLQQTEDRISQVEQNFKEVKQFMGTKELSVENLKSAKPESAQLAAKIADVSNMIGRGMSEAGLLDYKKQLADYKKGKEASKSYDLDFNARQTLGDDLYDITDKFYGNNNVIGSKDLESHGTHVAGIVGASRNNAKGVNGVANNVKIMAVRVVPDGDEHDKDIALGIRYAVDNGAKVINTSFGKAYSPNKQWVYEAIKYAAKKDVLIVNAAGNDGKDIDVERTYPNDSEDLVNEISDNVLTIGAMSLHYDEKLPATFSNYGKMNVDVFAPGVGIYATFPKDEYQAISGTSMAAPSSAGVAALVRSYYPQLSASQVKHILMNSGIKINFEVIKPGTKDEKVPFSDLSVSGRVVNAYNAVKMADRIVNGKK